MKNSVVLAVLAVGCSLLGACTTADVSNSTGTRISQRFSVIGELNAHVTVGDGYGRFPGGGMPPQMGCPPQQRPPRQMMPPPHMRRQMGNPMMRPRPRPPQACGWPQQGGGGLYRGGNWVQPDCAPQLPYPMYGGGGYGYGGGYRNPPPRRVPTSNGGGWYGGRDINIRNNNNNVNNNVNNNNIRVIRPDGSPYPATIYQN